MDQLTPRAAAKAMRIARSESTVSSTTAKASSEPTPAVWLRRLWERMTSAYPFKWAPAMGDSPQHPATLPDGSPHPQAGQLTVAGDTWARGLAGLTGEQIGRGLEGCINSGNPWPPTLTEFKARALDIPSFAAVSADSVNAGARRMPFTTEVFRRIDLWSYRQAPEIVADKLLKRAYDDVFEDVMRGLQLPAPLPEIEHDDEPTEPPKRTPAVAQSAIAEILRMLKNDAPPAPSEECHG